MQMDKTKSLIKKYSDVIAMFLASRVCFLVIIFITGKTIPELIHLFDSELYYQISQNGYDQEFLTAFFPMVPLIMRCLTGYGLLIVNQICLFISMVLLKKLLEDEYKSSVAKFVLLIFAFSPVSYFSLIGYTESIFFVLTLASFYLFVKNKFPWLMGILLGLSVFTRNTGSIVFFALFAGMVIRWIRKETKFTDILLAYVPATIISVLYPIYLQVKFGNWKIFVDCQYDNWIKVHSNLFKTYYLSLKTIFTNEYEFDIYTMPLFKANEIITILITGFLIFLCIKEFKRIKKCDTGSIVSVLIVIMSIVIFASTIMDPTHHAPTRSYYRYFLGMFPAFTLLHDLNPKLINALVIISVFFGVLISAIFFRGTYFY